MASTWTARAWARADLLCARFPVVWALTSAGFKGALGDQIAQRFVEGKSDTDLRRTAVYTTFSGLYLGGVQYFVQCRLLEHLFPGRSAIAVVKKVCVDQFVHLPFLAFPCLYLIKETFMPNNKVDPSQSILNRSLEKYRQEAKEVNIALWKFWIPATTVGFAVIPTHWRIPYNSGLSLAWTIILSNMQARLDSEG
mmetsp:Transcript_12659/g.17594  ORF Transcript_12659/g.17594 Transcript_12659/m.17594 type:complete len:195 (+) Transcript_12659:26-610(+)